MSEGMADLVCQHIKGDAYTYRDGTSLQATGVTTRASPSTDCLTPTDLSDVTQRQVFPSRRRLTTASASRVGRYTYSVLINHFESNESQDKKRQKPPEGGFCYKRETGFEPATSTLARLHSTTELLPHR